jgi:3-oxoacyl-[acyl-carrier protein] reductase
MKEYILITGANNGIAFELCKLFLNADYSVIAISRSNNNLSELQSELKDNSNCELKILQIDISTEMHIYQDFLKNNQSVKIKHIVNAAGQLINKSFENLEISDFQKMMEVNFFAPVSLVKMSLPRMIENSHIVNIGSMGGYQGSQKFQGLSAYSSSKAALMNFSEILAEELKERKVFVNSLALGAVDTKMLKEAFPGYKTQMTAHSMAEYIYDFTLNGWRYFNGKVLPVTNSTP